LTWTAIRVARDRGAQRPFPFQEGAFATGIRAGSLSRIIPDCDAYRLSVWEARRRGLKIIFVRHTGDDFPCAIDLVSSGRVNVTALVMPASLNTAPELFEALAESRLGYLKALLYPNGQRGDRRGGTVSLLGPNLTGHNPPWANWICGDRNATPFGLGATHHYLQPEIHKLYERVVASYLKNRAC
jgi:hypothetical protein